MYIAVAAKQSQVIVRRIHLSNLYFISDGRAPSRQKSQYSLELNSERTRNQRNHWNPNLNIIFRLLDLQQFTAVPNNYLAEMSVTFKAFLYERSWRGDPIEIRRFNVDQDVSSSYTYLLQKINQVFPSLTTNNVVVAWTGTYMQLQALFLCYACRDTVQLHPPCTCGCHNS